MASQQEESLIEAVKLAYANEMGNIASAQVIYFFMDRGPKDRFYEDVTPRDAIDLIQDLTYVMALNEYDYTALIE